MTDPIVFDAYTGWVDITDANSIPTDARRITAADLLRYEQLGVDVTAFLNGLSDSYVLNSRIGQASGAASLGADGKVPAIQIPDLSGLYLPASLLGTTNGVATLDGTKHVPAAQVPDLSGTYLTTTQKAAPNGVASLDSTGMVSTAQLPADFGYLYAGFTGNGVFFEKMNLLQSSDGKSFQGGAVNPIYTPVSTGTSFRDPSFLKVGDMWFVAYTANNGNNKNFEIVSSTDLLNWTLIATVNCSAATGLAQCWAPELVKDTNGDVYAFFTNVNSSSVLSGWYVKATNPATLTSWSAPTAMTWASAPTAWIDGTFLFDNGVWHHFYGLNGTIQHATSATLTGTWTTDKTGDWAGWKANSAANTNFEAPEILKLGTGRYRIYMDRYVGTANPYVFPGICYSDSSDLLTWTAPVSVATDPGFPPGQVMRHGGFIKLTDQKSLNTAQAALSARAPIRHAEFIPALNALPAGSAGNIGALTLSANDNFKGNDFVFSNANQQLTIGVDGIYSMDWMAVLTTACGGGWMAIKSPDQIANYASQDLVATASAWGISFSGVHLKAGSVLQFFISTTNATTLKAGTVIRVTKVG